MANRHSEATYESNVDELVVLGEAAQTILRDESLTEAERKQKWAELLEGKPVCPKCGGSTTREALYCFVCRRSWRRG